MAKEDPFDVCIRCGHARRAHDGGGCGKWEECSLVLDPIRGPGWPANIGRLCPCTGFVAEKTT